MRKPSKPDKKPAPSPDDTQEMFAAGGFMPPDADPELELPPEAEVEHEEPEVVDEELGEDEDLGEDVYEDEEPADDEWEEPVEEWAEDLDEGELEDEEPTERDQVTDSDQEPEPEQKETTSELVRAWLAATAARVRASGSELLSKVAAIKLPRHEIDGQKVLIVAGALAVILMVGAGGYVLGKGSGEDVDTARLSGEFEGKKAGAIAGATKGYAAGFKKGRDIAFRKAYSASYRRNYIRAYENAGMDAPKAKRIEVPEP